jgi:Fur family peroxide stress response transcriptional regulator
VKVETTEVGRRVEGCKVAAKRAGVTLTHPRLEICREIAASVEHPSAELGMRAVQPKRPTISLDTVYRPLWPLTDLGLVSTLGPQRESVRCDANLTQHHHHVRIDCGLARDFDRQELNPPRIPAPVRDFGSILGTRINEGRGARRLRSLRAEATGRVQNQQSAARQGRS